MTARAPNAFPHPVALPYSLLFDDTRTASERRWALCFTQYQVLRLVVLAHVGQYLRDDIDATAKEAVKAANREIAALKSPMFSNWVTAVRTLPAQWPALGLTPLFPGLVERLKKLPAAVRSVPDSSGTTTLPPMHAIVALRNSIAHGGLPDEARAERHLAEYLPVLEEVLAAFDFLGDCRLLVCEDPARVGQGLPVPVRELRGAEPPPPAEVELSASHEDAFRESVAVLVTPADVPVPLDPLLRPLPHDEPLYLYDGHYGIKVTGKTAAVNRYVYYLGVRDKRSGTDECRAAGDRLRDLLAARNISYDLPKERVHPWTVAEAALDYSRRTLDDLLGTKYIPECYEPFPAVDEHLDRFLSVPDRKEWKDTSRPRFRNGLLLLGTAGSGKTALLARRVGHLLARPARPDAPADPDADRANPNVVLFLRGNGIVLRPGLHDGVSLFHDVAEKLGVSVGDKGVGSFDELLAHLHKGFVTDQVPGRRLVLVFDALNEAPFAETVTREALNLVSLAARFPWCKVVLSTRDEWLAILPEKMTANEADPRAEARDHLYDPTPERPAERRLPALALDPLTADHAERIYRRHQERARATSDDGYAIPACATPWDELPADVRKLLTNPLYLSLFQRAFAGRPVGAVAGVPELYAAYVESAYERNIGPAVRAVVEHLIADPDRTTADLTDDDVNALRLGWAAGRTAAEIRTAFHPAEMLVHEGFVTKRVREEGGGYRFVYQTVAEYLIYRHLRDAMPKGCDESAYWLALAKREKVFPEYAGAMLFLLRDWEQRDEKRVWIGRLVADGADWTGGVLTKLLDELARTDFVPGKASVRGERLAGVLAEHDSERVAGALAAAGSVLTDTRFAPTAVPVYHAAALVRRRLLEHQPGHFGRADRLAGSLNNLANLLRDSGRVAEANAAYTDSVRVYEDLERRQPDDARVTGHLAAALTNLGILQRSQGRLDLAEASYSRSVQLYKRLHHHSPDDRGVAVALGAAGNNLANLLNATNRPAEAEAAYRHCVRIYEELYHHPPREVESGNNLAAVLNNLGNLLDDSGRAAEAETAYTQSMRVYDELHSRDPGNVVVAAGLASVLNNLGIIHRAAGRWADAEAAYTRSVRVREGLARENPGHVRIADGLARGLNNLGNLLLAVGRAAEALAAHTRSVEIREGLYQRNPTNIEVKVGLAGSLDNVGRHVEARQLVNEVLAVVPNHPGAKSVDDWLRKNGH